MLMAFYVLTKSPKVKVKLLNPHGSDETELSIEEANPSYELLNPHGSDETFRQNRNRTDVL